MSKAQGVEFILVSLIFTFIFFSFVSADVISVNSGGGNEIVINPDKLIEGFFFSSSLSLDNCGTLSSPNSIYTLSQNVSSTGTCFIVAADNITLDCQNHLATYSTLTSGYGIVNNGYDSLNLKNCEFNMSNYTLLNSYGVYVYGNAINNTIDNVKITTTSISSGSNKYNYGIFFNNVYNSTIKNSNISTLSSGYLGYANYGIYLNSGNGNWVDNNYIFTNNYNGYGIDVNSQNNNISNNVIKTLFTNSYGIYIHATNNYFYNNIVTTYDDDAGGDSSFGIYLYNANNSIFRNNQVVTYMAPSFVTRGGYNVDIDVTNLAEGKPVWYNDSLNDYTFLNLNFSNYGQVVCAGCNNVTYKNSIIRNDGLFFGGTQNSFVNDSEIISDTSHAFYLFYSNNNLVENSNISQTQNYVNSIKIRYSNYNTIQNSYIYESSNDYAIYLQNADYNTFYNNLIDSYGSGYAVLMYGSTDYENFTSNNFNCVTTCIDLDSQGTTQSYFEENNFNCGSSYSIYAYRGNNHYKLKNNNHNGDRILFSYSASSQIYNLTNESNFGGFYFSTSTSNIGYLYWYLDAYVNDTNGNDIENAEVRIYDSSLNLDSTQLTDSNGWINRQTLREYYQDSSSKYFDGNYTMNTSKLGYFPNIRKLNMTKSKIEYVTLLGTPPIVNIISPNETNYTTVDMYFNVSVIEDENVSFCYYSLNNMSNMTMNRLNDSYFWYFNDTLGPGDYNITFSCNDTSNNWGFNSTNFTILAEAAISISFSQDLMWGVEWHVFYLPSNDLDAVGNNNNDSTDYYINISAINTLVDIYVKADGNLFTDTLDELGLGNETYSVSTTNSTVPKNLTRNTMTTDYVLIGEDLPTSTFYMKFYLDAPGSQPAGVYKNGLNFKAVKAGEVVL